MAEPIFPDSFGDKAFVDDINGNRVLGNDVIEKYFDLIKSELPLNAFHPLIDTCKWVDINTPLRIAHFVSQVAVESDNFQAKRENLHYSAPRLRQVFPKYFPDVATANEYANKPEMIANRVYANRMGNGNEQSGDGWKYRGGGYIQLTGKYNYKAFSDFLKLPDMLVHPELIEGDEFAMESAGFYWCNRQINAKADGGSDVNTIKIVTYAVNGGYNGLDGRIQKFNLLWALINPKN